MLTKIIRENSDILQGIKSCVYTEQVNAETDLRVGCVSSASIEVSVYGDQDNAITKDEKITYYQIDERGDETKIGVFYAQPTISTKETYTFTAYDAVSKLETSFSDWLSDHQDDFPMTLLSLVQSAASVAGVDLVSGFSFPLYDTRIQAFTSNDVTCRQIFMWAAEIAGRFVRCNADGEVLFDWYDTVVSPTINPTDGSSFIYYKQDGLNYSNYMTSRVDRVAVYPTESDSAAYIYPSNVDTGNTYDISGNMLLTNASTTTYLAVAENIYTILSDLGIYRPFEVKLFPFNNPFRAGQKIHVQDSQGVSFSTLIMTMRVAEDAVTLTSTGNQEYKGLSSTLGAKLLNMSAGISMAWKTANDAKSLANSTQSQLTTFAETVNDSIEDLQSQIDGAIETWYYNYVPTLNNAPANSWTTDEEKNNHIGDLFYDSTTGYAYRFMKDSSTGNYLWTKITDVDVTEALSLAQEAQDTADGKRRVFVAQPTPPYDQGDLWMQGSTGDILTCMNPKTEGQAYSASDWQKLNKYGLGISTQTISYQRGTSGTVKPTGTWQSTIPPVEEGEYLWTRTYTVYTDGTNTEAFSVARQGADGEVYVPMEYIESPPEKNARISTGYAVTTRNITLEAAIMRLDTSHVESDWMGNYQGNFLVGHLSQSSTNIGMWARPAGWWTPTTMALNEKHTVIQKYLGDTGRTLIVDGFEYNNTTIDNSGITLNSTNTSIGLFAGSGTTDYCMFYGRMYYAKIYDDDVLVRDFIPVQRVSDQEYGMYDRITGTFYGSVSAGKFTGSPIVSADELAVDVGGRNMLSDTQAFGIKNTTGFWNLVNSNVKSTLTTDTYNNCTVRTYSQTISSGSSYVVWYQMASDVAVQKLKLGKTYIFSFWAKGSGNFRTYFWGTSGYLLVDHWVASDGTTGTTTDGAKLWTATSEWQRYWIAMTMNAAGNLDRDKYLVIRHDYNAGATLQLDVAGCKFEEGNTVTDWTPAPEDAAAYVDGLEVSSRNLLRATGKPLAHQSASVNIREIHRLTGARQWSLYDNGVVTRTDEGIKFTHNNNTNVGGLIIPLVYDNAIENSSHYILTFKYKASGTIGDNGIYILRRSRPNIYLSSVSFPATSEWTDFKFEFDTPADATTNINYSILLPYFSIANVSFEIKDGTMMLTKGDKQGPWMPAPEDEDERESSGRNLIIGSQYPYLTTTSSFNGFTLTSGGNGTASVIDIADSPIPECSQALRISNNTGNTNRDFAQKVPDLQEQFEAGKLGSTLWVFSGYVRAVSGTVSSLIRVYGSTENFSHTTPNIGTEWQYLEIPLLFRNLTCTNNYLRIQFGITGPGSIEYIGLKLERGNYATPWSAAPEDYEVGGTNLLRATPKVFNPTAYAAYALNMTEKLKAGQTYTLQYWNMVVDANNTWVGTYWGGGTIRVAPPGGSALTGKNSKPDANGYYRYTFTVSDAQASGSGSANSWLNVYNGVNGHAGSNMTIGKWKLEKGNVPTEWSAAPEDVEEGIDDAKKVANNYLSSDSTGIMVADLEDGAQTPSTATGRNVKIDNDSVDIRNGQTVLASFGEEAVIGEEDFLNMAVGPTYITGSAPAGEVSRADLFRVNIHSGRIVATYTKQELGSTDEDWTVSLDNTPMANYPIYIEISGARWSDYFMYGTAKTITLGSTTRTISYDGNKTLTFAHGNTYSGSTIYMVYPIETSGVSIGVGTLGTDVYMGLEEGTLSATFGEALFPYYDNQLLGGKYNAPSNVPFAIGNGSISQRSNAFEVDWDGNATVYGDLISNNIGALAGSRENNIATKSIPNNTDTILGSFTIPSKGTWLVYVLVRFSTNTTGRRYAKIVSSNSASAAAIGNLYEGFSQAQNYYTDIKMTCLFTIVATSSTNYVAVWQNSGGALNAWARWFAIRIK